MKKTLTLLALLVTVTVASAQEVVAGSGNSPKRPLSVGVFVGPTFGTKVYRGNWVIDLEGARRVKHMNAGFATGVDIGYGFFAKGRWEAGLEGSLAYGCSYYLDRFEWESSDTPFEYRYTSPYLELKVSPYVGYALSNKLALRAGIGSGVRTAAIGTWEVYRSTMRGKESYRIFDMLSYILTEANVEVRYYCTPDLYLGVKARCDLFSPEMMSDKHPFNAQLLFSVGYTPARRVVLK